MRNHGKLMVLSRPPLHIISCRTTKYTDQMAGDLRRSQGQRTYTDGCRALAAGPPPSPRNDYRSRRAEAGLATAQPSKLRASWPYLLQRDLDVWFLVASPPRLAWAFSFANGSWKGPVSTDILKSTWQELQGQKMAKRKIKSKGEFLKICLHKNQPKYLNSSSSAACSFGTHIMNQSHHRLFLQTQGPIQVLLQGPFEGMFSWKYINIYSFPPLKEILDWKSSEYQF